MLVNFRVENFLSYNDMSLFTMVGSKSAKHQDNILKNTTGDLLKFAAIYGANASGKSNLTKALSFAQEIIVRGLGEKNVYRLYNLNHSENSERDSKFEFEILLGNKIYTYGFSMLMSESKINTEWLYDVTDEEVEIFVRDEKVTINFAYLNVDEKTQNRLMIYAEDIESNSTDLFLTSLNNSEKKKISAGEGYLFSNLYNWFRNVLEVLSPYETTREFGMTYHDKKFLEQLGKYLKNNDTGVSKVDLYKKDGKIDGIPVSIEKRLKSKISVDLNKNQDDDRQKSILIRTSKGMYFFMKEDEKINMYELRFIHSNEDVNYSYALSEESDGTVRLVELFSILYNKKEKVFIIDELDRSLHPLLTHTFVEKFLKKKNMEQLIITTHEDRLLDLSLLRRDEIWFAKKNIAGDSTIYSLDDYEEHFDDKLIEAYLDGRYGGIPQIEQLFSDFEGDD